MNEVDGAFRLIMKPMLSIMPSVSPSGLAKDLISAAHGPLPMGPTAVNDWWDNASPADKTVLARYLARAIPEFDDATKERFDDLEWRVSLGIPLVIATFALARRSRKGQIPENTVQIERDHWRLWRAWCKKHRALTFNPNAAELREFLISYESTYTLPSLHQWRVTFSAM